MDPVNPLHPAFAALRQQLAENIERLRKSGRVAVRAGSPAPAQGQARAPSMHAAMAARMAGIDRRSAQGRERATRALVEVALLAEFGEELLADPAFGAMLEEISANLRADADIRAELDALIEEL